MPPIDFLAAERHFVDHLAPIWEALGEQRGTFTALGRDPDAQLVLHGIPNTLEPSVNGPILVASYGDLKKARRLGRTQIALIEHGYGQTYTNNHPSYAGGRDRDDVGLFLVPNEHAAQRNREANPEAMVEVVGCPKLDSLPKREDGPSPTVALSFHWDCRLVTEAGSTFRFYAGMLGTLSRQFNLIGHGHPRMMAAGLARAYRRSGIEIVDDFAEVCRRADVYVCDNSSTLYEFASTGRPVVVLNAPWFRRDVEHGLRFWEAATVGVQVETTQELVPAIRLALSDPPSVQEARERAVNLVYAYRSGAAQRAAAALRQWSAA